MKTLGKAILAVAIGYAWLVLVSHVSSAFGRIKSQQDTLEMDEQTKAQVKRLRAISETVKACPRAAGSPDTGNGAFYYGPPSNVIWDVKPNPSVRAPYMGYIEFFLPREFVASKKYCTKHAELCAQMMIIPSFEYRFKFDLGSDEMELEKILAKPTNDREWSEVRPNAAGLAGSCWLKAAQSGELKPDKPGGR